MVDGAARELAERDDRFTAQILSHPGHRFTLSG
jgi:hypothetical protein